MSSCRTDALTARVTASSSSVRPAAVRPTRPLPRRPVCRAIAAARAAGQPGNNRLISSARRDWKATSSSARSCRSRSRRRARASSSTRQCSSASSKAGSSTRMPCRSYRLRARLQRTTTADRLLACLARRVSAVSPAGRNTKWSRSAHLRQSGPASLMTRKSPEPPQPAQVQAPSGRMTSRSVGACRRSARFSFRAPGAAWPLGFGGGSRLTGKDRSQPRQRAWLRPRLLFAASSATTPVGR